MASEAKVPVRPEAAGTNTHSYREKEAGGQSPGPENSAELRWPQASSGRPLRSVLESLHEFVLIFDSRETILHFWHTKRLRSGPLETNVTGQGLSALLDCESMAWVRKALSDAERSRQCQTMAQTVAADGRVRVFAVSVLPAGAAGEAACLIARDVTEPLAQHDAALEREAIFAQAEELANVGSWEFDVERETLTWSPHFFRMLGLRPEDGPVPYERAMDIIHPEDRERAQRDSENARRDGTALENEIRFLTADRGPRLFHSRATAVRDDAGRIVRIRGMSQDVTDWRAAEAALRAQEALLAHAEQIANIGSWESDFVADKATVSANLRKILGVPPDFDVNPEWYWTRIHPDDRGRAQEVTRQALKTREPFQYVARYGPPNGGLRFLHVRGVGVPDPAGKTAGCMGVVQDISEQREAEEKRREREALLAEAEEVAHFGSWNTEFPSGKTTLSPYLLRIYGLETDADWTASRFWERVHPDDREWAQETVRRATEEKKPFDCTARYLSREGAVRFVRFRGVPILDAAGKLVRRVGVAQDITAEREAEDALRLREALLAHAEEIANFGSWRYDYPTNSFVLSPNMRRILNIGPDDPWTSEEYWHRVHPADRIKAQAVFEKATEEGKPFEFVVRFYGNAGGVAYLHTRGVTYRDEKGRLDYRVGVAQDITERVRSEIELRNLSGQLIRAQDDDRRRIAHELHESAGQSLAALKMTLGRLREFLKEKSLATALMKSAADLADEAVREVRTISYLMHPPMLDELGLAPALRWYARGFSERSGIRVVTEIPDRLPRQTPEVEITLFRVVQETLTNVHRHSGGRTAHVILTLENDDVCLVVRDDGCGVVQLPRMVGLGDTFGVGIAGMRERVKQLHGTFDLASSAGMGTTVRVTLPGTAERSRRRAEMEDHLPDVKERRHGA